MGEKYGFDKHSGRLIEQGYKSPGGSSGTSGGGPSSGNLEWLWGVGGLALVLILIGNYGLWGLLLLPIWPLWLVFLVLSWIF